MDALLFSLSLGLVKMTAAAAAAAAEATFSAASDKPLSQRPVFCQPLSQRLACGEATLSMPLPKPLSAPRSSYP